MASNTFFSLKTIQVPISSNRYAEMKKFSNKYQILILIRHNQLAQYNLKLSLPINMSWLILHTWKTCTVQPEIAFANQYVLAHITYLETLETANKF